MELMRETRQELMYYNCIETSLQDLGTHKIELPIYTQVAFTFTSLFEALQPVYLRKAQQYH